MSQVDRIVDGMFKEDLFSQWLGIEILERSAGACKVKMTVRKEMQNGFGVAHGGITYSLADSALAFACNSQGIKSMSIETSISHIERVNPGDILIAEARELSRKNRVALYAVQVHNQDDVLVADFKGTVYRSGKEW